MSQTRCFVDPLVQRRSPRAAFFLPSSCPAFEPGFPGGGETLGSQLASALAVLQPSGSNPVESFAPGTFWNFFLPRSSVTIFPVKIFHFLLGQTGTGVELWYSCEHPHCRVSVGPQPAQTALPLGREAFWSLAQPDGPCCGNGEFTGAGSVCRSTVVRRETKKLPSEVRPGVGAPFWQHVTYSPSIHLARNSSCEAQSSHPRGIQRLGHSDKNCSLIGGAGLNSFLCAGLVASAGD